MSTLKTLRTAVRSFLSPFAIFPDGHAEKVTFISDDGFRTFACVLVTDGVTAVDPRSLTFATGHAVDSLIARQAMNGNRRASTARRLTVDPRLVALIGKGQRRTLREVALHYATVSETEAYGTTLKQRVAMANRIARQSDWTVSEF